MDAVRNEIKLPEKTVINWDLQPNFYIKKLKRNMRLIEVALAQLYDKGIINCYRRIKF